jgi:hypothetical protein
MSVQSPVALWIWQGMGSTAVLIDRNADCPLAISYDILAVGARMAHEHPVQASMFKMEKFHTYAVHNTRKSLSVEAHSKQLITLCIASSFFREFCFLLRIINYSKANLYSS